MLLRATDPDMATGPSDPPSFWDFLDSCDREWMWECFDNPNRTYDMIRLVDRMKNNITTWCMDGSYHRKLFPKVSRAGCMTYCTNTNNRMTGNF